MAGTAANVFVPTERTIVRRVLSLAERPVKSIMTPAPDVIWLELEDDAHVLSRRIVQTGHAAYPVCRGGLHNLVGVARAPDLVCDLLQSDHIDPNTLEKNPLSVREEGSVLDLVEQLQEARVPMAIVHDDGGTLTGVVTSTDLLETILGKVTERR